MLSFWLKSAVFYTTMWEVNDKVTNFAGTVPLTDFPLLTTTFNFFVQFG